MASGLDNNQNTGSLSTSWLDDLLVKDQSGKLHNFHQAQDVMVTTDQLELNNDIEVAEPILPTIYVAPKDDSFYANIVAGQPKVKAEHAFHPDDERHLAEVALKIPVDDSKKYSLEKIIDKILEKQKLVLDPDAKQIFSDLMFDFFRNRKNAIIVREYLSKINVNNQPIAPILLDTILSIAKTIKANIEAGGGLVVRASELAKIEVVQAKYPAQKVITPKAKPVASEALNKEPIPMPSQEKAAVLPPTLAPQKPTKVLDQAVEIKNLAPANIIEPKIPEAKQPIVVKAPEVKTETFLPKVLRPQATLSAKPKMADVVTQSQASVKVSAKKILVGPVDELANMSIDNFRRLGIDASARTQKIYEKISILEKDSVSKKAAGIAAWRQSPVYQQYLDIGASSLIKGQDIVKLINERSQQDKQTLSIEEFNAVGDLNKLLRF